MNKRVYKVVDFGCGEFHVVRASGKNLENLENVFHSPVLGDTWREIAKRVATDEANGYDTCVSEVSDTTHGLQWLERMIVRGTLDIVTLISE